MAGNSVFMGLRSGRIGFKGSFSSANLVGFEKPGHLHKSQPLLSCHVVAQRRQTHNPGYPPSNLPEYKDHF